MTGLEHGECLMNCRHSDGGRDGGAAARIWAVVRRHVDTQALVRDRSLRSLPSEVLGASRRTE